MVALFCAGLVACGSGSSTPPLAGSGGHASASGGAGAGPSSGSGGSTLPGGSGGAPGTGGEAATATGGAGGLSSSGGSGASGGASDGGRGGVPAGGGGGEASATGGAGGRGGGAATGGAGGRAGNGAAAAGGRGGSSTTPLAALMVITGTGRPTAGDNVMLARLAAHGIRTTTMTDAAVTAASVAGMDLVVISSSAESGPLAAKLRDVTVPVLCIENGEFALMGMTPATLNTDFGMLAAQSQVQITMPGSPLVGGLSGTVTISSVAGDFGWGIPAATALGGASLVGNPGRSVIFGYAKGDQMVGMVAPARRAAFAIRETLAANLTADGTRLFDAILSWVLL